MKARTEQVGITVKQAREWADTSADVFTPNGDAGVISHLNVRRAEAFITGQHVNGWYRLTDLTIFIEGGS